MSEPPDLPPDPLEGVEYLQEDRYPPPQPLTHEVLEYARPIGSPQESRVPFGVQALLGSVSYFLILVGAIGIAGASRGLGLVTGTSFFVLANLIVTAVVQYHTGWRGFRVGVLISFPLTCLIGIGAIAILCGGLR